MILSPFNWRVLAALALTLASIVFSFKALAHGYDKGDLHIDHPWARATMNTSVPAAVYFDIRNAGAVDDRLLSAWASRAEHVELHASVKDPGTGAVKMRRAVDGLAAPAGETMSLNTGSYHVMLIGLKAPLTTGEVFPMKLIFEKAGPAELLAARASQIATAPSRSPASAFSLADCSEARIA